VVKRILSTEAQKGVDSTSAVVRLLLEIGLFWMEYKVYWDQQGRAGRLTDAPTPLP